MVFVRWWKVFTDAVLDRSGRRANGRQRRSSRFSHRAPVVARCSSWPKFLKLFTGDISEGGLFVPTPEPATVGETIELELELPDHSKIPLTGTIVNVISQQQAAARGRSPGIGIRIEHPSGKQAQQFELLLKMAKSKQLRPEDLSPLARAQRKPLQVPPGTEPVRLSSVHNALSSECIDQIGLDEVDPAAIDPLDDITWQAPVRPKPESVAPPSTIPKQPTRHGIIIGIDLGTSNTSVATIVGDRVKLLENSDGQPSFPSVLHIKDGEVTVGHPAKAWVGRDPGRTIVSPKRLLGRSYDDREIQGLIGQAPYRTMRGPDNSVVIEIDGNEYAIVQLCGYLLGHARTLAEKALGERIDRAVVSVPVSFDDDRADLIRRAGRMAGIEVVAVIDEPSAAALANRFDADFGGVVGVYDFGGGTFDFSIVDVSAVDFIVLATAGDRWLGGDDFDTVLAEAAANQFWRKHKVDIRNQAAEWRQLLNACERAKRALSTQEVAAIVVPDVLHTAAGTIDLRLTIDRPIFERACQSVIRRSLETCREALELVQIRPSELSAVFLSGGTTYIPAVRSQLAEAFGVPVRTGVPPDFAVCLGTAIHAAQLQLRAGTVLDER